MTRLMSFAALVLVTFSFMAPPTFAQDKPSADKPPAVSETVKLQIENADLKHKLALATAQLQICQSKIAPEAYKEVAVAIQGELAKVVQDFEKAHPGWTLDVTTMQPKKKGGD
jgi:hypothetical protein